MFQEFYSYVQTPGLSFLKISIIIIHRPVLTFMPLLRVFGISLTFFTPCTAGGAPQGSSAAIGAGVGRGLGQQWRRFRS